MEERRSQDTSISAGSDHGSVSSKEVTRRIRILKKWTLLEQFDSEEAFLERMPSKETGYIKTQV